MLLLSLDQLIEIAVDHRHKDEFNYRLFVSYIQNGVQKESITERMKLKLGKDKIVLIRVSDDGTHPEVCPTYASVKAGTLPETYHFGEDAELIQVYNSTMKRYDLEPRLSRSC